MWRGDFNGNGFPTLPGANMTFEVEKSLDNQMLVMEKTMHNQMEGMSRGGAVRPSNKFDQAGSKPTEKVLRRLEQHREATRKCRLRKKAYVQHLENSQQRLAQLEHELQVRQHVTTKLAGIAAFEMEYGKWVEELLRRTYELRNALHSRAGDNELHIHVESCRNHYIDLFNIKAIGVKADVCYIMSGAWRTQAERLLFWNGGFRPSQILRLIVPHLGVLTKEQDCNISGLEQSCQDIENVMTKGLLHVNQFAVDAVVAGQLGEGNYLPQMDSAIDKLEKLVHFANEGDNVRKEALNWMCSVILTTSQAARGLVALGEFIERLHTLSSLWVKRPRELSRQYDPKDLFLSSTGTETETKTTTEMGTWKL